MGGASRTCIPGCMSSPGQWATDSYRGAKGLGPMLRYFEEYADAGTYNEVVCDAAYFAAKLPWSIEAVYYHRGVAKAPEMARQMQRALARHFHSEVPAGAAPPVLTFDT